MAGEMVAQMVGAELQWASHRQPQSHTATSFTYPQGVHVLGTTTMHQPTGMLHQKNKGNAPIKASFTSAVLGSMMLMKDIFSEIRIS